MVRKSLLALVVALFLISGVNAVHATPSANIGGIGDVLLGSAYDVRALTATNGVGLNTTVTRPAQWENFIEISNTDNRWVAFQLRFRSASKSIEVWDHIILLSPYDVLWLSVTRDSVNGGLKLYSSDTHTLRNSGLITASATEYSWSIYGQTTSLLRDCGYLEDEMSESEMGYIEAIGLWSINSTNHSISAIATPGYTLGTTPNVYDLLYYMWGDAAAATPTNGSTISTGRTSGDRPLVYGYSRPLTSTVITSYPFLDCPNVLRGSIEMGDVVTGAYQTDNFIAVKDFRTRNSATSPAAITHRDGYNGNDGVYSAIDELTTLRTATYAGVDGVNLTNCIGYDGGVIGYPVMLLTSSSRGYTAGGLSSTPSGSDPREIAWYANADVATTVGPILKDGDHDVDLVPGSNATIVPENELGSDYGFNSPGSLFDLESAFEVDVLWGFYNKSNASDAPFNAINKSSAVLTFFTKHDHFLFGGWLTGLPGTGDVTGLSSIMNAGGVKVKSSLWAFWNGSGSNYSIDSLYAAKINAERALVAAKWLAINGAPGYVRTQIWDMNQNIAGNLPVESPSPWSPNTLPNEMNMVDVGDASGILPTSFIAGQFSLNGWVFDDDQYAPYFASSTCYPPLPVIGMIVRDNYKGTGVLHRTSSSPYQFTWSARCVFAN